MRMFALLLLVGGATVAQAQPPKSYTPGTPPRAGEETLLNARVVSVDRAGSRLTVRGVDVKADGGNNETFNVAAPASSRLAELTPGMEVLLTLSGTTVTGVKVSVASGGEGGNVIRGNATTAPSGSSTRGRARPKGASGTREGGTSGNGGATSAPATGPTPGMIGVAPGTGAAPVTNTQGTFILQGSPAPAVTPRPRVKPQTGTAPQTGAAPQTGVVSPQPAAGAPVTGGTTGPVGAIPITGGPTGTVFIATPSPAPQATPFPTPRPQGTPIPVGTPRPVLLPSEAPSPSQTPTPSPQVP